VPNFSLQLIKQGEVPRDVDLVHYPYFDLFFLTLPLRKLKPTVVTIHDVIPLLFPERYPRGVKGWLKFQVQKQSLRGVRAVITDSENSREDIVKYLNFRKEKIFVVPLAPGEEFRILKSNLFLFRIKEKYQLPERFVLYVGDVNWNKNVEGLIKAFAKSKIQDPNLKLILVGKAFEDKNLKETNSLLQSIKELNLINQVKILGYVPTSDLVGIYNLATVYCQPSFYEGFGLSVLEAMACGCPVVAAKTASLPEICGKAAVMVDAGEIGKISEGLIKVIGDHKLRRKLIQEGLKQVKKFSWEKVARQTIDVYRRVIKTT